MNHTVLFRPSGELRVVEDGTTLLQAAQHSNLLMDAHCGGAGTCGKCQVLVRRGGVETLELACRFSVTEDLEVELGPAVGHAILTTGTSRPVLLSSDGFGIAFDLGTTTVVGYLMNLATGEQLAVASSLNPQVNYGTDVLTRAKYALDYGGDVLADVIRMQMREMIADTCAQAAIAPSQITRVSVVGNPCMHHLFLGLSPKPLVFAPYQPAVTESLTLDAEPFGLGIAPSGTIRVFPNIAGFVGGDAVGALLALQIGEKEPLTLLIDIGTNGEIVLGNRTRMLCCSTAAGPAFEGAKISCGMRGAEGAIDHLVIDKHRLNYSVIGGGKPAGICGSGLIDLVAELLKNGMMDRTGRLLRGDPRIEEMDGVRGFLIAGPSETSTGKPIALTQKDIRELQLAKAAIAAGIQSLTEHLSVQIEEIAQVYLAGAFGNYMSPDSACAISMIPANLRDRIVPVGNAAGEGAKIGLLSAGEFQNTERIAAHTEYLELASDASFQRRFIEELEF